MAELSEQAEGWLGELRATFDARRKDYSWAEVVGGYSTSEHEPILAHLVIRFHPAGDDRIVYKTEYPHFTLFSQSVEPDAGWKLFVAIAKGESVSLGGDLPTVHFRKCTVDQPSRHWSRSYPFNAEWPIDVGLLNGTQDGRLRHELLATHPGPIFTGPQEAIDETTGAPVGWRGFAPAVYLLMTDRRARLVGPRASTKGVSGIVERGPVFAAGLVLKCYASSVSSSARRSARIRTLPPSSQFEADEPGGPFEFETGFFPNHLILALIEKGSNSLIDVREFEPGQFSLANDLVVETNPTSLEALISSGESKRLEFKENFEGGDGWIRTVSAFANGEGGVILFGVRNDSTISGLSAAKTADSLAQRLRGAVEPFPSYRFGTIVIQGKQVAYVEVDGGDEKPYTVRDQGVFVRAQATTRQATRYELMLLARPADQGTA